MKKNRALIFCVLYLTATMASYAQVPDRETLMKYVSSGNAGTEFWVSFPPAFVETEGASGTTSILVFSPVVQPITVEVPGKGFSMTKMSAANNVIEFNLPLNIGQPYIRPTQRKAPAEKVYEKCGVHIMAGTPIVVYGMTRVHYSSDGFLAIPVSKLGSDYIIASWPQYTAMGTNINLPALSNIVAAYDDTKVTFTMGGDRWSKTTGGLRNGQSQTWKLKKGDVLCFANDSMSLDIAGSRVVSNKPVGIVSGNQCATVPYGVPTCDFIDEMELPIKTWGTEYHVTPIVGRLKNPVIRVFAHPDYRNVNVYRDGVKWKTLPNYRREEYQAFITERVYDGSPRPAVITANAPIYVMLYNTGESDDDVPSDPFQLVLTPVEQYQTEITFATPSTLGFFDHNYVNIVYAMEEGNSIPSDLEFAVAKNGEFEWSTLADRFGPFTGLKFVEKSGSGEQYAMKRITLPAIGTYCIRAKKPFAAYVYGFSDYDSYGFPAGANVLDASIIDTTAPGIIVTKTSKGAWSGYAEDFYTRIAGAKSDEIAGDKNGIIASICLLAENSENIKLEVQETEIYKSLPVNWSLTISDMSKKAQGTLVVSDNFGNYTYKEFNFFPTGVTASRKGTDDLVCNVTLAEEIKDVLVIQNVNPESDAEILDCSISDNVNFTINISDLIGKIIPKDGKIEVPLIFLPKVIGDYSTTIKLTTKTQNSTKIDISGIAKEVKLSAEQKIVFDSTIIGKVDNTSRMITLRSQVGKYKLPAKVIDVQSVPEEGVSFKNGTYGSEGFQINKNLFINKMIDPEINNKIDVPVKFRAVKEGLHKATVSLYLTKDKPAQTIELVGYGKSDAVASAEEEDNDDVSIYTNITNQEIVVQSKSLSLMKEYSIINQIGEVSLTGTISSGGESYTIPVQNLPSGMYIFSVEVNGKKVNEKVLIQY